MNRRGSLLSWGTLVVFASGTQLMVLVISLLLWAQGMTGSERWLWGGVAGAPVSAWLAIQLEDRLGPVAAVLCFAAVSLGTGAAVAAAGSLTGHTAISLVLSIFTNGVTS